MPDYILSCRNKSICIDPPTNLRIVITAGYIVESRFGVIVIPTIPEGIKRADNPLLTRCRARLGGNRAVAPRIVCVRAYLGSVFRVDGDNVPLQVLLEVVGVKRIRSIGLASVLQPDGSAVLIIEVYQEVVGVSVPLLLFVVHVSVTIWEPFSV